MKHVALLRGINVGGKNKLAMKDLCEMFAVAGCTNVETYIQSGNVVFAAEASVLKGLAATISAAILKRFGYTIPVVLRSAKEISLAVAGNPYLNVAADEKQLHTYFLADPPDEERVALLEHRRSEPDEFAVVGQEIYLRLPNGMGRTKLTNAYFDSKLGTTCTARSWATVC
jgi:uncharacterized protein (DUF1697 family)